MSLFQGRKHQRVAKILQRVQAAIEREGGDTGSTIEEGLAAAAGRAGADLEVVRSADLATLELVLGSGGRPDPANCWAVAEVLYVDGLRARSEGEDARPLLEKARALYGHAGEGLDLPEGVPPPAERVRRIEEILDGESPDTPDA